MNFHVRKRCFTRICIPVDVSLLRTMLTSWLAAKSSMVLIGGFIFGVVRDEVTIPVYELTKTIAHSSQTPAKTRNEVRLLNSLPPDREIRKLLFYKQVVYNSIRFYSAKLHLIYLDLSSY